jgi:uncharacterized protein with gpF-like domain
MRLLTTRSKKPVTVRAVHPNAGVEHWYRAQLEALVLRMHNDVSAAVIGIYARHAQPTGDIGHDAASKNPSILLRRALEKWGGLWVRKLDKLSLTLATRFARKNFVVTQTSMKAAFREAGFTVSFKPTPLSVEKYHAVAAEQVNLIRSIPAEYLKAVKSDVWNSVMKGGDLHSLSQNLQKNYGVTAKRAAFIARSQNNMAAGTIEKVRQLELGITDAFWQHSHAGEVPRPTHLAADGRRYKIAQGLWDKDAHGKGKGAFIQPGELINCRCTNRPILPFL